MSWTLKNWTLAKKIPTMFVALGVVAAGLTGYFCYNSAKTAIQNESRSKLTAILGDRHQALNTWFKAIESDLSVQAKNPTIKNALVEFSQAWTALGNDQTATLHKLYIDKPSNPHPVGKKEKLDAASDGSQYSKVHAKYHPYLRSFLRAQGYYDVFLFDLKGNLVYTVFKELDFATNLLDGKWAKTDLGEAYRSALVATSGKTSFFDFKPYSPSNNSPASFISTPVMDNSGKVQGVLVFQMPIDRLNNLMHQTTGLGETGETYLVGSDLLLRSDSRFIKETSLLKLKVDTGQVHKALSGQSDVIVGKDYRNVDVVSAFKAVNFKNTTWALLAEQDYDETFAKSIAMGNQLLLGALVGFVLIAFIGVFLGRRFSQPITQATEVMVSLAQGDTTIEVSGKERGDEIGKMSRAVDVFRENAVRNLQLEEEQSAQQVKSEKRRKKIDELTHCFNSKMTGIVESITVSSGELQVTASSMSSVSEETSSQADTVTQNSQEASHNVESAAESAQEMSDSISQITGQITETSDAIKEAVSKVELTSKEMEALSVTADQIEDVVKMISDIADQTNLLALNATIESARAGDAGKGFAVVASEVKSLSNQTGIATEKIVSQVEKIQSATKDAVVSMVDIQKIIDKVNDNSLVVAATLQEHGQSTREISGSIFEASTGTREVAENMNGVREASHLTGAASTQVIAAADDLAHQAKVMKSEVDEFIYQIEAA